MMSYFNSGVHKFLILLKLSTFVMLVKHFLLSVFPTHIFHSGGWPRYINGAFADPFQHFMSLF